MIPLISVIIPVYNGGAYIHRAIESVTCQKFESFEIIVVDDGSTDNSGYVCDKYANSDDRISVIHQSNAGVCAARNVGLDCAKGEYVTFLDADDELLPNALQEMYDLIIADDGDISVGQKMVVQLNGSITSFHYPDDFCVWSGTEALQKSLDDHPALYSSCGKLYKADVVKDVRFVVGKRIHEDSYFLFKCMLKRPRVVVSDICVFKVYYTSDSASRGAFSDKYFDMIYFSERKKYYIEKLYPEFTDKIPNMLVKVNMALLHTLSNQISFRYLKKEFASIKLIRENKAHFRPAIKEDERWFKIVTSHLYFPYKIVHILQKKVRILKKRLFK